MEEERVTFNAAVFKIRHPTLKSLPPKSPFADKISEKMTTCGTINSDVLFSITSEIGKLIDH